MAQLRNLTREKVDGEMQVHRVTAPIIGGLAIAVILLLIVALFQANL